MSQYDDTNSGALFKNDKGGNPKRPDYRGFVNVNGVEFWCSGWIRKAEKGKRAGETFMSLSLEPKGVQDSAPSRSFERGQNVNDFDDDIPF